MPRETHNDHRAPLGPHGTQGHALPDGRFVVARESAGANGDGRFAIRLQLFNSDGSEGSAEFTLSAAGQAHPVIAALAEARLAVAWEETGAGETRARLMRGQIFKGDGSKLGRSFVVYAAWAED